MQHNTNSFKLARNFLITHAFFIDSFTAYGATKSYVDHLSRALQTEYANKNIVIQSILPAYVSTKMSKIRKASAMVPTPKDYINAQMKTVGFENRYVYYTGILYTWQVLPVYNTQCV